MVRHITDLFRMNNNYLFTFSLFSAPFLTVILYKSPFLVLNKSSSSPYRSQHGSPLFDFIIVSASLPSFHFMLTSKPPLAHKPLTVPSSHTSGSAGNRWMNSIWLCISSSHIPAVPPKFPSIWNGAVYPKDCRACRSSTSC